MAIIPIVNRKDRNVGAISAFSLLLLLLIILQFLTYTQADPPPKDIVLEVEKLPEELQLKVFTTGGGAAGDPTNAPKEDKVTPQMQETIRDKNSKSESSEAQGKSNHTNQNKSSNNQASTTVNSDLLFKPGGKKNGDGTGKNGFGKDDGEGDGQGSGNDKKPRIRLNDPNTDNISSDQSCKIALKLTINSEGDVVRGENLTSKTTTTNQIVINQVIANVKSQVKYNKVSSTGLEIVYLTVLVSAK